MESTIEKPFIEKILDTRRILEFTSSSKEKKDIHALHHELTELKRKGQILIIAGGLPIERSNLTKGTQDYYSIFEITHIADEGVMIEIKKILLKSNAVITAKPDEDEDGSETGQTAVNHQRR